MPRRLHTFCALCVSRCGAIAVLDDDDRFVALEPDPSHPTGKALCAKGRAGPELVYHQNRLAYPLKRTRPKGDPDPGWQRISWDEAFDTTAARLRQIATESGPESVVFTVSSPSTSASSDALIWIERLTRAFGSPNICASMELCGWGRYGATMYTFGASVPGMYMPDIEAAGCILFWGYNPNLARLAHATATSGALKRGAKLIVVDPRRAGPAAKADLWLRVRPGTDAALALGIAHVMIQRGWYDADFIRQWTNGPFLVRGDNGRLLTERDISTAGDARRYVTIDETSGELAAYDATTGRFVSEVVRPALFGERTIDTLQGPVACRPAFALVAERCSEYPPARVAAICDVEADHVERAARMLWESRPVAYYAWSGVEMQSNSTQIARAIAQLYVLTGNLDAPGGNVLFESVPTAAVGGENLMSAERRARTLGARERPMGPARMGHTTAFDVYRAILEGEPYRVRGVVGFGANLLLSHAASRRGRDAFNALEFYVHADLFMNPTAELADIVVPVASAFEREALKIGFEVSADAQSLAQLRPRVAEPRGESRADVEIVFELARRLGLGHQFWNGDIDAAYEAQLAPSGITLAALRGQREGIRASVTTRYRKFAEPNGGAARGFATPTRKIELYSETLLTHGIPPLPCYEEPLIGPISRPDLAARFPLVLTCAKNTLFCETQHRSLPSLRRRSLDPEVELHPSAAAMRGIGDGDWVRIATPAGSVRARARLNDALAPNVACGQHGWWEACPELGAPGYDPFSEDGANFNLVISDEAADPVSGSVPHRAYLCEVSRA